jgi:hypothetical protein
MNPNDTIRNQILQYFFDRNVAATSHHGKKGSAVKISDAKRELRDRYGLKQQQVVSNLTYLIGRGWVRTFDVEKTIVVPGGTVPSKVPWYEISADGIDKIEGGSEFEPKDRYQGINVTATGTNVITLGNGNVVKAKFSELHDQLAHLESEITLCSAINEKQKLDLAVDIETIRDQLAKESPDRTIIGHLWSGIDHVATVAGLVDAVQKVWPLIKPLLFM